jgi:hypothetical protein
LTSGNVVPVSGMIAPEGPLRRCLMLSS